MWERERKNIRKEDAMETSCDRGGTGRDWMKSSMWWRRICDEVVRGVRVAMVDVWREWTKIGSN